MAGIFKRGYTAVANEKKRQEEERAKREGNLWRFFLAKDGDEADIKFLTEEPVNFDEHTKKMIVNGKDRYDSITCIGEGCIECEEGDRPTFKGAYLIIDRREYEYKDKDGKQKKGKNQVRLYVQGTKVLSQLARISSRGGITNREMTIVRLGKGTSTTYTFEKADEETKMTKKEIEQILPDSLKEKYDGTMDSLYSIVEEQIMASVPTERVEDDDEEDEVIDKKAKSRIISADEDDEEPKKAPTIRKLGFKSKENSVKSLLRK